MAEAFHICLEVIGIFSCLAVIIKVIWFMNGRIQIAESETLFFDVEELNVHQQQFPVFTEWFGVEVIGNKTYFSLRGYGYIGFLKKPEGEFYLSTLLDNGRRVTEFLHRVERQRRAEQIPEEDEDEESDISSLSDEIYHDFDRSPSVAEEV